MSDSIYIHGTDPEEQQRLSGLNDVLNQGSVHELRLRGGEKVLDVGAGLGQLSRAIARQKARVVAVERSPEQLAQARKLASEAAEGGLVDFRAGDALALPLAPEEWGTFDVAHTRFLLEHVPDPLAVVKAMVKAVHRGGRIVLEDDDHDILRLWPEPPGFQALWSLYTRTYDRNGNDPFVGRRLVSLLHQAGAQPTRNTWVRLGGCSGEPDFPFLVENIAQILIGARAAMQATGALEDAQFERALEDLRAFGRRPDAAIWYGMSWAEGRRP
jgi:SAM-dependent methyltransferase